MKEVTKPVDAKPLRHTVVKVKEIFSFALPRVGFNANTSVLSVVFRKTQGNVLSISMNEVGLHLLWGHSNIILHL